MSRIEPYKYLEDDFDGNLERGNLHRRKLQPPKRKPKREEHEVVAELADGAAGEVSFDFTYEASRHERAWMLEALTGFYDMQWISDVVRQVQGGKEASVYQCQAGEQTGVAYIAAKIYRPRRFRNLKNDFLYREGRSNLDADGNVILDDHLLHAIRKRTEFGRQLMHTSWIEHEYQTLEALHAAGGDVPQPFARGDNAILMGYIGGDEQAAPTLNSVELDYHEARRLFDRVLYNIELMLSLDRIHGDLSAYNILYWDGEITLIDFPQVISPNVNRSALAIFTRDVTRVCEYFARQGVRVDPQRLATRLWTSHHHRLTPELDPHLLDAESDQDRSLWKQQTRQEQRRP